jgi:hypothetical protein
MALYWLTERSQALLELVGVEQRSFAAEIGAAPPLGERGSVASEVLTSGIPKAPLTAPGHIPALNLSGRQSADWRRQQSHSRGGRRTTRARQRQRHDSPSARRAAFRHAPKRPKTALLKPKPLGTHFGTLCRAARDAVAGSGTLRLLPGLGRVRIASLQASPEPMLPPERYRLCNTRDSYGIRFGLYRIQLPYSR